MSTVNVIKLGRYFSCKINKNASLMDWVHVGLDLLGFIPAFGEVCDAANFGLYIGESNYFDALLSAISLLPAIGDVIAKASRAAVWVVKSTMSRASLIAKYGTKAIDVLKNIVIEGKIAFKANKAAIMSLLKSFEVDTKWAKFKPYFSAIYNEYEKVDVAFSVAEAALST